MQSGHILRPTLSIHEDTHTMAHQQPDFDQLATERTAMWGTFMVVTKWTVIAVAATLLLMAATIV
jgi:hypothetical protein